MSQTLPSIDGPGDAELISAVRGGDVDAYGDLFARHVGAARSLARQLVAAGDVDDLVSDAFAKVLGVLQRGGGPDLAFRAYLLTAVRRLHVDRIRARSRLHTTDDMTPFDPGVPFRDTAVEGFENAAAAAAFASLPERWQLVLWHTEVEGQKPAEVATLLGMTPNSVSALAYRAREGLRQAFLNAHAQELEEDTCRWVHGHLGAYVRNGLSRRDAAKVEAHLEECRTCLAIYIELTEVNSNLRGILAPLLLGGAALGYLAASSSSAAGAAGGIIGVLDRLKDGVVANAGTVAAGAAVAGAVAVGGYFALAPNEPVGNDDPGSSSAAGDDPGSDAGAADGGDGGGGNAGGGDGNAGGGGGGGAAAPRAAPPETEDPRTEEAAEDTAEPVDTPVSAPPPDGGGDQPGNGGGNGGRGNDGDGNDGGDPDDGPTRPPVDPGDVPVPPPPPPPPPGPDLTVSVLVNRQLPGGWEIIVVGEGLGDAGEATVLLTADGEVLRGGARCDPAGLSASTTCDVSASNTQNYVDVISDEPVRVTLTITPSEGTEDSDPDNNTIVIELPGVVPEDPGEDPGDGGVAAQPRQDPAGDVVEAPELPEEPVPPEEPPPAPPQEPAAPPDGQMAA